MPMVGRRQQRFPKRPARPSVLCRLQGNRAAQHHPDPSAGLSLFADADREVTGATNLECYMQDPDFGYQDFARHDEDQTQVFRVQVRFLLSWQAAAWAATSPLPSLSPPGGVRMVVGVPMQPGSGAAAFAKCRSTEARLCEGTCPTRAGEGEMTRDFCSQGLPIFFTLPSRRQRSVIQKLSDEGYCGLWQSCPYSRPVEVCVLQPFIWEYVPAPFCSYKSLLLCSTGLLLGRPWLLTGQPALL